MENFAGRLEQVLNTRRAYYALLVCNLFVVSGMMWATRNVMLSDGWSYIALAEGILHGEYSMFWPLEETYPDTFRTPGYPLLIAGMIAVFGTWNAMVVLQFVMYWLALFLTLKVISYYDERRSVRSLFLLLLLPVINVPFYITQIYTEIPVLAAIALTLYLIVRPGRWSVISAITIGLVFGFIFQCKPIFLFFPFIFALVSLVSQRRFFDGRGHTLVLLTFVATLLPFGVWNLHNHGVFRVTPVQGGPGYMHFSIWCGKMPGYTDTFSLRNFTGDELVRFVPEDSIPVHIAAYEKEWGLLQASLTPLLTAKDTLMLRSMSAMPYPPEPTFNTEYTLLRERLLTQKVVEHVLEDPWYVFAYKSYSAIRLWVIGIQRDEFVKASVPGRLQMLYATGMTFAVFLLFVGFVTIAYRRRSLSVKGTIPMLLYIVYFGVFHIPFTIQARYTTPVRFAMLALLALAMASSMRKGTDEIERAGTL